MAASSMADSMSAHFARHHGQGAMASVTRGMAASATVVAEATRKLEQDPEDVEARLCILGATLARGEDASEHVLYLITHRPELDLGAFWGVHPRHLAEARTSWEMAMAGRPEDPNVFANAAWSTVDDVAFSDAAYERGRVLEPRAKEWHLQLAQFVEFRRLVVPERAQTYARQELDGRFQAFCLEDSPESKLLMLWSLRQAATAEDDLRRVLRLADIAGSRALKEKATRPLFCHHLSHVAFGLVLVAFGKIALADDELTRSLAQAVPEEPDVVLAQELLRVGARDAVVPYLERCADRFPRTVLGEILGAIRRGETVDLGVLTVAQM
jgi:hypothetical protein